MEALTRPAALIFTLLAVSGVMSEEDNSAASDVLSELAALNQALPGSGAGGSGEYDADTVEYIGQLWEDIENAFQYLEHHHLEDLRRLAMQEVGKRLPLTQHNFVRFGKRTIPGHSFVRIGRQSPSEKQEEGEKNYYRFERSSQVDKEPNPSADKRYYHRFVRFGRSSRRPETDNEDNKIRPHQFDQRDRSFADFKTESKPQNRNYPSSARRFERSPEQSDFIDAPAEPSESNTVEEKQTSKRNSNLPPLNIRLSLNKKRYATARIGRLPAMLFYHNRRNQGRPRPSTHIPFILKGTPPRAQSHRNSYPRYG
ncbi:uncharacterized protein LOC101856383 [Aplysia californica]|uniref:Uncharacterized protein LOC101856383 n=1 Tax=Aplysia californica TaxID=6500 RepID=A0ABM0K634_APLCA|nr:uncharacterized protein LOC101856383 [Aplysia californica]XP_005109600.1 uncharacterized protein LOC101856383 [Aplysia californica]